MALIPNLSDIPELTPVPDGEYTITVTSAKEVTAKDSGRKGVQLGCRIEGEENAETLFHKMWFPMEEDDEAKQMILWRMVKEALLGFGLPAEGVEDVSEFMGCEATVRIKTKEFEGRYSNEVAKFV